MRASVYGRQSSNKAKSINEQLESGMQAIRAEGWQHAGTYKDGVSASRYGTKTRSDWQRLLADLKTGAFDVLVLWESSRGDRTLSSWAEFLEQCRKRHVRIHVIADDHTYDLERPRDWKTLATAGVDNAAESDLLSIRVKRGHAGAAADGKPGGGPCPFGYRRVYDQETGKRREQVINPAEAEIVREIFTRVAAGHTIMGLVDDLNRRAVRRSRGTPWARCTIRELVRNPAYVGRRVVNGTTYQGSWEPIVTEAQWRAAQQVLARPERRLTRPGRQKHLLSYLARCAVSDCGDWINQVAGCYRCVKGCVSIPMEITDGVVREAVLARLKLPEFIASRSADRGGEAERAEAEAGELRAELNKWRLSAARKQTSPESLAVIEDDLLRQIAACEARSVRSEEPAVLLAMLEPGVDVRQRWNDMTVIARRALIDSLCVVRIARGRPGRRGLSHDPVEATFTRLGESQWRGDEARWGSYDRGPGRS